MDFGIVIMMDALGFRDTCHRCGHENVVRALKDLKGATDKAVKDAMAAINKQNNLHKVETTFLSDTLVIGATSKIERESFGVAMTLACHVASKVIEFAASSLQIPFIYRGAISAGEFMLEGPFIAGPAVDDAAGNMEEAEAAVVWFTPGAMAIVSEKAPWASNLQTIFPAVVPLKGGYAYETLALNPFPFCNTEERAQKRREDFLGPMRGNLTLGINIKLQNTASLLTAAFTHLGGRYIAAPRA